MSEAIGKMAPAKKTPVFPIACWALGLVGFSELVVGGMALAARLEDSKQVKIIEREKLIPVEISPEKKPAAEIPPSVVTRMPVPDAPPPAVPKVEPAPIAAPVIADPMSERLVRDARKARVAGDMMSAITKLNESIKQSPEDPSVHYEMGLVFEAMGIYDKASEHYEKVFQMGVSGAGSLYELAAAKLRDGFEQPGDSLGKLALGRLKIFKDTRFEHGERVILTVPVQKSPGAEIDPGEIQVEVQFFNRTSKGEIVKLEDRSWAKEEWPEPPFDFAGGEEPLRVTYVIPSQDLRTRHLFGQEKHYGQVVSLYYKGEILDVQAWPRDLAGRVDKPAPANALPQQQEPMFDQLPPNYNPDAPLLPLPTQDLPGDIPADATPVPPPIESLPKR
jgi:hypothetical protein